MDTYNTINMIIMTIIMLIMVISGGVMIFRTLAPTRMISFMAPTKARLLYVMEIIAVFIFIPGTIALYSSYIKALFSCK
ncbi:IMV protein [Sea otter poxvirus]|uniref:IMV protein n=1 Tax=Sea otter poxvirus TaxID=1416741 RepID=A0A2U9QHK7_9POXV|nr:IMV protein [Sea otter poxvirus]AWU47091.1 IMV protein [Sea otter poxvirus]